MWVMDLVMKLVTALAGIFQREKQGAPFLAAALGAATPLFFLIYLTDDAYYWDQAKVNSYGMVFAWLPSLLIGTILGGILGRHTSKNWPDSQVFLAAYIWGLIGGLNIPGILLFFSV